MCQSCFSPGSLAARHHAEDLAQLQAKVEMLLRHQAEGMGPRLPPAVFPPPVAPPLPPALALAVSLILGLQGYLSTWEGLSRVLTWYLLPGCSRTHSLCKCQTASVICSVLPVPTPIKAAFFLPQEPPRPTLRTGSPTASSRPLAPSSLPSIAFGALDDPPPPTQEAPALHKRPQR